MRSSTIPLTLESGEEVYLGASLGVAVSAGADDTPARLLRDADVAMFAAKELGRGRVEIFDETMRERAVRRLELEGSLRRALCETNSGFTTSRSYISRAMR